MLYSLDQDPHVLTANKDIVDFIQAMHQQNYSLYATTSDIPIDTINELKGAEFYRNFAVYEFSVDKYETVENVLSSLLNKPKSIIYRISKDRLRLVISLKTSLSSKKYKQLTQQLATQLQIVVSPKYLSNINHAIKFKSFTAKDVKTYFDGTPLDLEPVKAQDPDKLSPSQDMLIKATHNFIASEEADVILHNRTKVIKFFDALIASYMQGMLTDSYLQKVIRMISAKTGYDLQDWQNLMTERMTLLKKNPGLRENAEPFGTYIHLYDQTKDQMSLGRQLQASLPENTKPSSEYDLADACNFIEMAYPPYLLDQYGDDEDNVVIFDPTKGIWTHQRSAFYSLLTAIKPYSTKLQCDTFIMTFAAKARIANRLIKPYSGSRYLLFKNCVLDVKTMKKIELSSTFVHDLHFTERARLDIDYVENPPCPQLRGQLSLTPGKGAWNPRDYLMAYANNDQDRYIYLLFGLSLGLFGGHNFGVHFDIQGGSRSGKSTLLEIYNKLYNFRTQSIPFSNLNNQFPFSGYSLDTSIIWINETNEGTAPLDDEHGTTLYDNLADNQVHFQVKGKNDIVLSNPPQVYIDGTQFIKANELYTGPAGRTLAFKLPTMTDDLRRSIYAVDINQCLHDDRVAQWFAYNFIMAYKEIVPENRIDYFKLNLASKDDLNLFPKIALDWRKEFVVGGSSIDDWYTDEIAPYISQDKNKPTYLHPRVIYAMYLFSYKNANPNDPFAHEAKTNEQVIKRIKTIWDSEDDKYVVNYNVGSLESGRRSPRKRIKDPSKMNFDWVKYDQDFQRPDELQNLGYKELHIFDKKSTGWISVYKK